MNKLQQLTRELFSSLTLIHVLAVALPLTVLVSQVWGVRFTTYDDASFALHTQPSERFVQSLEMAKESGRVFFLYYMPFLYSCISQWQTPVYDVIQYGSFVMAFGFVTYVLSTYVSPRFAFLFALVYISTLTLQWNHTLITSNPIFLHVHVSVFCVALLCLKQYVLSLRRRWQNASLGFLAMSVIGIEFQAIVFPVVYVLVARAILGGQEHQDERHRHSLRTLTWAAITIAGLYVLIYFAWRLYVGNQYEGVAPNITSFDVSAAFGILVVWTLSGNIFFNWMVAPTLSFISTDLLAVRAPLQLVPIDIWTDIPWYGYATAVFVVVSLMLFFNQQQRPTAAPEVLAQRYWRWLPVPFLTIAFVPSLLLSVTTKYQHWFTLGVNAYAYTSISAYGVAMLFSWIVLSSLSIARSKIFKFVVQGALCVVLGLGALTNSAHNTHVATSMQDGAARWWAVDTLLKSSLRTKVDHSVIVAPRLASFYWSVPTAEGYWEQLARAEFGVTLEVRNDASSVDWKQGKNAYYFDFFRSERTGDMAILLIPLSKSAGSVSVSREGWIATRGSLSAYLVGQGLSGRRFVVHSPALVGTTAGGTTVYPVTFPEQPKDLEFSFEDRLMWAPLRYASSRGTYLLGEPIDFSEGGNSAIYKLKGWSVQETKHTWALGTQSELEISPVGPALCDLVGELDVAGFTPPGLPSQRLQVYVNGSPVWAGAIASRTKVSFEIPQAVWNSKLPVQVVFSHPDAASPANTIGGTDVRILAVDFFSFLVRGCTTSQ